MATEPVNAELNEICEMFDVRVMQDYWSGTDEHPELGHAMYALGQHAEPAAGLRSFRMTPWFDTMGELSDFCERNQAKLRELAEADPDGPAPDATNWI